MCDECDSTTNEELDMDPSGDTSIGSAKDLIAALENALRSINNPDDDHVDGVPFPGEKLYISSYEAAHDFFGGRRIYDQVVKELGFDPLP